LVSLITWRELGLRHHPLVKLTRACAAALRSAATFMTRISRSLFTVRNRCTSTCNGFDRSPVNAAAIIRCGGSLGPPILLLLPEAVSLGEKSLSSDDRLRGEGGWKGCELGLGLGLGGNDA
jgi:hypothetical protein